MLVLCCIIIYMFCSIASLAQGQSYIVHRDSEAYLAIIGNILICEYKSTHK